MGLNGPCFELIFHDNIAYESWIDYKFTFMHKGVLVIMQSCIGDNEQGF